MNSFRPFQELDVSFTVHDQKHVLKIGDSKSLKKNEDAQKVIINGRSYYMLSDSKGDIPNIFKDALKKQKDLSASSIKESLKELHSLNKSPIRNFKLDITTELTTQISSAMDNKNHNQFMKILFKMTPQEASKIKPEIMRYIEKNRLSLCEFINERKLQAEDKCSFKPLSSDENSSYHFAFNKIIDDDSEDFDLFGEIEPSKAKNSSEPPKVESYNYFAENVEVFELKDSEQLFGHAIVCKNKAKCDNLGSFQNLIQKKDSDHYEVMWIATEEKHKGKGLGYLLLYNILAKKLNDEKAKVHLTDSSGFTGTRIYENVHLYKDELGNTTKEFDMTSRLPDYTYFPLKK
ncbi:MAG: GNAT family N-acetyltransferase [Parachlamydiaceae bacterium]|nr:GNAT family N-acetyltransferase [Parachlamydiaceae bacterium]